MTQRNRPRLLNIKSKRSSEYAHSIYYLQALLKRIFSSVPSCCVGLGWGLPSSLCLILNLTPTHTIPTVPDPLSYFHFSVFPVGLCIFEYAVLLTYYA